LVTIGAALSQVTTFVEVIASGCVTSRCTDWGDHAVRTTSGDGPTSLDRHSPRRIRPRHRGLRPGHAGWPRDGQRHHLHLDAIDVTDVDAFTDDHDTDGAAADTDGPAHPDQAAHEESDEDGEAEWAPAGAGRRHPATG
jgi:hypothetical protein